MSVSNGARPCGLLAAPRFRLQEFDGHQVPDPLTQGVGVETADEGTVTRAGFEQTQGVQGVGQQVAQPVEAHGDQGLRRVEPAAQLVGGHLLHGLHVCCALQASVDRQSSLEAGTDRRDQP